MPLRSQYTVSIPSASVPQWLFGSPEDAISTSPALLDAASPDANHLSLTTLRNWSRRLASGLVHHGLRPDDRVMLISPNSIFVPVVFLGTLMANGIFTGCSPAARSHEIRHQMQDAAPRFVLAEPAALTAVREALQGIKLDPLPTLLLFDANTDGQSNSGDNTHWSILLHAQHRLVGWQPGNPQRVAALNYSSGTTGLPKGVETTHANLIAFVEQWLHLQSLHPAYEACFARARWLAFLPMYHILGQTLFILVAPKRGIPCYIMSRYAYAAMVECLQAHRITELICVPSIAQSLVKDPRLHSYRLGSVERVSSGAAPLRRQLALGLQAKWPNGPAPVVKEGWGMTECTCGVLGWHPLDAAVSASVGELYPNSEGMVVDIDTGVELQSGQRGEIWVRGPSVVARYWRNDKATSETFTRDGWLRTGDIGYYDGDGKWYIVDRLKELIKVKGIQVVPAELEAMLVADDAVLDAAVIGITRGTEERPKAFVVLRPNHTASAQDMQALLGRVNERLSRTKQITGGIQVLDEIPRNPAGKILRRILREMQAQTDAHAVPRAPSRL